MPPEREDGGEVLVLRPRRLRIAAVVMALALVAITVLGWLALPREIRVLFTLSQRLTLLTLLGFLLLVMGALALSYVRADREGLRFRNGLRTHTVSWARVQAVILRPGDPWAYLLLLPPDGRRVSTDLDVEKRQLMGIQAGDGATARAAVEALQRRQRRSREGG
ncbi:MAG: PH domain-containing protein [Friedmanniella sp.]